MVKSNHFQNENINKYFMDPTTNFFLKGKVK